MKKYITLILVLGGAFFGCNQEEDTPYENPNDNNQIQILIKVSTTSGSIIDANVQGNFSALQEPTVTLGGGYQVLYEGDFGTVRKELENYDGRLCYVQGLFDCQFVDVWLSNLLTLDPSDYELIGGGAALKIDAVINPDATEEYYCDSFNSDPLSDPTGALTFTTSIELIDEGTGGTEGYASLPSSVKGFLSSSAYDDITNELGMTIHGGSDAACLEGSFTAERVFLESTTVAADPGNGIGPGTELQPIHLSFCNQSSSGSIDVNWSDNNSTGGGEGSYYSGSGNEFTIFTQLYSTNSGVTYESVKIVSGRMTSSGIQDCEVVTFMIDNSGNPNGNLLGNNEGRLVYDDDGLAERKSNQACSGC